MPVRPFCLSLLLASCASIGAQAAGPDLLVFGAGATDVLRNQKSAAEVRFEYRPAWSLVPFVEPLLQIKPWAGLEVTTRGSLWGGAGILLDVPVGPFVVIPSFGVGGYERGSGKNLGSALEFRSQIEVGYVFRDQSRVTAAFSHLSNAGITRRNPGTEAVVIQYMLPIGRLF
ncbi:MAG: acyloxyacyl hydrolase [Acetobacteraceae bacterium]|nr:acyloxyacyl hydrolase [Acetobacteraceae bacterium]